MPAWQVPTSDYVLVKLKGHVRVTLLCRVEMILRRRMSCLKIRCHQTVGADSGGGGKFHISATRAKYEYQNRITFSF